MVKKENRPENRFAVLGDFSKLNDVVLGCLKELSSTEKDLVFQYLVEAKSSIRTYNALNVFDSELLNHRVDHQVKAVFSLNKIKALVEDKTIQFGENRFGDTLFRIDNLITKILQNQISDKARNAKGKETVKKDFLELKHKQFYDDKEIPFSTIKKGVVDSKDPFSIKDLVFDK